VAARTLGNETIVASGLQAGEQVVTDGQARLTGGTKVEVRAPAARAGGERPRDAGAPARGEGAKDTPAAKDAPATAPAAPGKGAAAKDAAPKDPAQDTPRR